jgi:ATP-dependent RNA helicase DHX57
VFHEKVRTTRIYVRDCSTVSPYALMLFGGALSTERTASKAAGGGRRGAPPPSADTLLTVDNWIKFSVPRHAVDLLLQVRAEMDAVLRRKIENPNADISAAGRHILDAVVALLGSEGGGDGGAGGRGV